MQFIDLMNKSYFSITCDRLHLVPLSEDDLADYLKDFDDEVTRYLDAVSFNNMEEMNEFYENSVQLRENGMSLVCSIKDEKEEFLGSLEIHMIDTPTPEVSIWLKKSARGKGYGLEALLGAINFLNMVLDAEYYIYQVDERNFKGIELVEKLYGRKEGHRSLKLKDGRALEFVIYHI